MVHPRKIYYGLHMVKGVAQYKEFDGEPVILVNEMCLKNMDVTFPGCPVFLNHVEEVKEESLKHEADGYVIESFFNKADGNHWVKFIVITEQAVQAISSGWKLSNAYTIKHKTPGGRYHGLDYDAEVMEGQYDHLAIVQNPRYKESIVLTPEQFKEYNFNKEQELVKLANEDKGEQMFKIFKQTKEDKSTDFKDMMVSLPKSKKEVELSKLINDMDSQMAVEGQPVMANMDHKVKVGEKDMSVSDLLNAYNAMCAEKMNADKEKPAPELENKEDEKKEPELDNSEDKKKEEKKEEKKDEKAENSDKSEEGKKNAEKIANAEKQAREQKTEHTVVMLNSDKIALGKKHYGSGK